MMENEAIQKALDSFNDHQKDNRGRATQLANYAFLIAGGTFTTSITLFASRPKAQFSPSTLPYLQSGWLFLLISIVSFLVLIIAMIVRDYLTAELEWRPILDGKPPFLQGKRKTIFLAISESILFVAGIFGLIFLTFGLHRIMRAAISLLA